jgi:MFS family permease
MVSELTIDHLPHQRATAFSMLPLMYGLGSIIGPMLGGFLSHPVTNYPNVFGHLGFITEYLAEYPYLLPCFISAFICTLGLIFGLFFLEETHQPIDYKKLNQEEEREDEEEALLINSADENAGYSTFGNNTDNNVQHSPTPTIHDKHAPPTLKEALTPSVVAICVTYGFFALQAVFMDGKQMS